MIGKIIIFCLISLIVCLLCLSINLNLTNQGLKKAIVDMDKSKTEEFNRRLKEQQALIDKDFKEKYHADMVSYQATAKRLEIELKRVRELEAQLNPRGN